LLPSRLTVKQSRSQATLTLTLALATITTHSQATLTLTLTLVSFTPPAQTNVQVQGPIINFSLKSPTGETLSYKAFEEEAAEAGFHLRTGAECNPGACYAYLGARVCA